VFRHSADILQYFNQYGQVCKTDFLAVDAETDVGELAGLIEFTEIDGRDFCGVVD
jgi:hypothetical protein